MIDLAGTLAYPLEAISQEVTSPFPSAVKVVATVGPASANEHVLSALLRSGVNVCRLNFSHGTHDYYAGIIELIRETAKKVGVEDTLAIALDTRGPEVRTAPNSGGAPIRYDTGQRVTVRAITSGEETNTVDTVYITYAKGISSLEVGGSILLADGQCCLRVCSVGKGLLECVAEVADLTLSGKNNVHLPGLTVDLESLSRKDRADIAFGVKSGVDMIFASFARNAEHIDEIRAEVRRHDSKAGVEGGADVDIPIIAKIESDEGIRHIETIIDAADGIMIARGDLGVELPVESLFLAQKSLTARAFVKAKPVICATQMLESMTTHNRPTRAEASDVANAVIDRADSLMLSGETAAGQHPVDAAKVMRRIAMKADAYSATLPNFKDTLKVMNEERSNHIGSIASAAVLAAFELEASFIVTTTVSGNSVRQLAKFRPQCPIIVLCRQQRTARALAITRGVIPIVCADVPLHLWESSFGELVERGIAYGRKRLVAASPAPVPTSEEEVNSSMAKPLIAIVTNTDMRPSNSCSMTIRVL